MFQQICTIQTRATSLQLKNLRVEKKLLVEYNLAKTPTTQIWGHYKFVKYMDQGTLSEEKILA